MRSTRCRTRPDPEGRLSLEMDGPRVHVRVRDWGTGQTDAEIAQLFGSVLHHQGAGKGMGLGLSISYNIVRDLAARSRDATIRRGAVFSVTLKLAEAPSVFGRRMTGLLDPPLFVDD